MCSSARQQQVLFAERLLLPVPEQRLEVGDEEKKRRRDGKTERRKRGKKEMRKEEKDERGKESREQCFRSRILIYSTS